MIFFHNEDETLVILLGAILVDVIWGEYPERWHPVVWMGVIITFFYGWPIKKSSSSGQRIWGSVLALALPTLCASVVAAFYYVQPPRLLYIAVGIFLLKSSFALKALGNAHMDIAETLEKHDIETSRSKLSWLCSRPSDKLSEEELRGASISSIAENLCDSVVAPIFFFVLFGIPGALFYRFANTADAMMGYRDHRLYLGWAPARLDDVLNFIPARITALILMVIGLAHGRPVTAAIKIAVRDHGKTPSPNGGWPMATLAGLLHIQLEKPNHYSLGDQTQSITHQTMIEAWQLVRNGAYLAFLGATTLVIWELLAWN